MNWPSDKQNAAFRRRLGHWIQEWETDLLLRQATKHSHSGAFPPSGAPPSPPRDTETRWSPGDIGLLYPTPPAPPVYTLILECTGDRNFLICPFSRFAEPATPGEWSTGSQAIPLRVLCLWNSLVATSTVLEQGWHSGRLSQPQLDSALELHEHLNSSAPLALVDPSDLGPPLIHPADPRWLYLEEESRFLAGTLASLAHSPRMRQINETWSTPRSFWPLAAEPPPSYSTGIQRPE
jgi:hypothetical protein